MRVAITTDRFESAAPPYERAGLDPVPAPCIEVRHNDDLDAERVRRAARLADVVVVTSARTVELLWPASTVPDVPFAAVGAATRRAIEARGGRVVVAGGAGLAHLVAAAEAALAGAAVVFPHGAGTDPDGVAALRELAVELQEFEVYCTEPVPPPDVTVDAVSFASPSAVDGWHLSRALEGLIVGAIGPTTAAAVARHRPPDIVAATPSHRELAAALARQLEVAR